MIQDKIGTIFGIASSIIGILIGVVAIVYRKRFLKLHKNYLSKRKDPIHQKMLESAESRSDKSSYILITLISVGIIILGIVQLIDILK